MVSEQLCFAESHRLNRNITNTNCRYLLTLYQWLKHFFCTEFICLNVSFFYTQVWSEFIVRHSSFIVILYSNCKRNDGQLSAASGNCSISTRPSSCQYLKLPLKFEVVDLKSRKSAHNPFFPCLFSFSLHANLNKIALMKSSSFISDAQLWQYFHS